VCVLSCACVCVCLCCVVRCAFCALCCEFQVEWCVCLFLCVCTFEVDVRQGAEKVWEALEMIAPGPYRHRVIQGVFKNLCKLILAGKLPYGVVLGYLAQSGCDIEVHEHLVGDRKVSFALPRGVELQSVAATGGTKQGL
jgi:hypothetical protein